MPPAGSRFDADDDSRVWDVMGRLVFSADSRTSPTPTSLAPLALADSGIEGDDSRVWEIMGRLVF